MCRRCHNQFMAAWRAEDAASELAEAIDGYRADSIGVAQLERDDELPQLQRRSAA